MTSKINEILQEAFMGLYYHSPSELGEDAFQPMDDRHNVLRDRLARELLDHLLSLPELQDFDKQVGDNPRVLEAYANQNLAKEYIRAALRRELGQEQPNAKD